MFKLCYVLKISLVVPNSDGIPNLLGACKFAYANYNIPLVGVYFNHKLMRGTRVVKQDANGINAFCSPNCPIVGYYDGSFHINETLVNELKEKAYVLYFSNSPLE